MPNTVQNLKIVNLGSPKYSGGKIGEPVEVGTILYKLTDESSILEEADLLGELNEDESKRSCDYDVYSIAPVVDSRFSSR